MSPPFKPDRRQRRLLETAAAAHLRVDDVTTRYHTLLQACRDACIPITVIAAALGVTRKVIYAHTTGKGTPP